MVIKPVDIFTYMGMVLGFVFLTIYLLIYLNSRAEGGDWKGAIPEALKVFGLFVLGSFVLGLLLSIPYILRGCIIDTW